MCWFETFSRVARSLESRGIHFQACLAIEKLWKLKIISVVICSQVNRLTRIHKCCYRDVIKGPLPMNPRQKIKVRNTFLQFLKNQHYLAQHLEQNLQTGREIINAPSWVLPFYRMWMYNSQSLRLNNQEPIKHSIARKKKNFPHLLQRTATHCRSLVPNYQSTQIHQRSLAPNAQNNLVCCNNLSFGKIKQRRLKCEANAFSIQ